MDIRRIFTRVKERLTCLSFRTGVIILLLCVPFYILSFAQMLLPFSPGVKTVLWVVLFGLAKTFQYAGLTILGAEGVAYIRKKLKRRHQ